MPGGLTRCEGEVGELTVSIQDGGVIPFLKNNFS